MHSPLVITSLAALATKKAQGIGSDVESEEPESDDNTGIAFSSSVKIHYFTQ